MKLRILLLAAGATATLFAQTVRDEVLERGRERILSGDRKAGELHLHGDGESTGVCANRATAAAGELRPDRC